MGPSRDDNHRNRDITIRIHDTRMMLSIPAEEDVEHHLREAAKRVNELLTQYRNAYPKASKEETLTYVALHCARDLCEAEHNERNKQIEQRLNVLLKTIEDTLM